MGELHEAEIRARIKEARKEAGLSQSTMADLLGVIPRTVQNYENDHVPWSRIRDIADITGKSTRWLLHGDDSEEAVAQPDVLEQLANVKLRSVGSSARWRISSGSPPLKARRQALRKHESRLLQPVASGQHERQLGEDARRLLGLRGDGFICGIRHDVCPSVCLPLLEGCTRWVYRWFIAAVGTQPI